MRNYYREQLASVINIFSGAGVTNFQLIVSYKQGFLPLFTTKKGITMLLLSSRLWWTILLITSAILILCCLSYERYQQQIIDNINRKKMQLVLESETGMLERLHETNDVVTGSHVQRVAAYSRLMAEHLNLDKQLVKDIHQFSSLHDIGKIS